MGDHLITVNVNFNVDPPVVTNPTNQSDTIQATDGGIMWASEPNEEELQITGIEFFSDLTKQRPVTPTYLDMPGENYGRMNWHIRFRPEVVGSEQTLYYKLKYKVTAHNCLKWDPVIRIDPRGG